MKKDGMEYWRALGSPELVLAPMVDASELPWRLLSRRHGAQLCYTPMLHSSVFCRDPKYRKEALTSNSEDRPLIVQFCGNDPKTLLEAAQLAEEFCDGIDINLGCPQAIARRGHYGSFLQDEWELLSEIVKTLNQGVKVPISCKVRIFPSVDLSVRYAQMLESAGCQLLTVHGRTREQKGPLTGLADWSYIKAVREAVKIPVFANGNIQRLEDVHRCIQETGVVGVMSAEGNLYNPCIYDGVNPPAWVPAFEYLDLVATYPCPNSYIRGHLFKIFHHILALTDNATHRMNLGSATTLLQFRQFCTELRDKYLPYHEGKALWKPENQSNNLELPPWICQPYVRMSPEDHVKKLEDKNKMAFEIKDSVTAKRYADADGNEITRKRMKKLRRIQRRPERPSTAGLRIKRGSELCVNCPNPLGGKCIYKLCKKCCRNKCYTENLDCPGHRIQVKTRREMALHFAQCRADEEQEKLVDATSELSHNLRYALIEESNNDLN